jgi:hypothetical protein
MRKLSGLILGLSLLLIVFCLSLGLFSAQKASYEVLSVNNLSVLNSIAVGRPSPAENATLDVVNWSRMQGIRVHTLIVDGSVGVGRLPHNVAKLAVDVNRTIIPNNSNANIIASFQNSQTPLNNNDTRVFDITQTASNNVVLRGVGRDVIIIGQNISLQPTDNVGIGTTNPTQKLDVQGGNIKTSGGIYWNNGVSVLSTDQGGAIELGNSSGSGTPYIDFHYGVGSPQDYNIRLINSGNGLFAIMGGNVGIGTTNPGKKFEVVGDILSRKSSGIDKAIALTADDKGGNIWVNNAYNSSNPTSGWIRAITINSTNGNVGIGTTNPGKKFEVVGDILSRKSSGIDKAIALTADDKGGNIWVNNAYNSSNPTSGWTRAITINSTNGNVGIGGDPGTSVKLSIHGSTTINGDLDVGHLYIDGQSTFVRIYCCDAQNEDCNCPDGWLLVGTIDNQGTHRCYDRKTNNIISKGDSDSALCIKD